MTSRFRLVGWPRHGGNAVLICLVVASAVLTAFVLREIRSNGSVTTRAVSDLGTGVQPAGATVAGKVKKNLYGYYVEPRASGTVWLPLTLSIRHGQHAILRLFAYGGKSLETNVAVIDADGVEHSLGRPGRWLGRGFDVTEEARKGELLLTSSARNTGSSDALFLDRVELGVSPTALGVRVQPLLLASWLALIAALLLAVAGQLRRHWLLPAFVWLDIFLVWRDVRSLAFLELSPAASQVWEATTRADWFSFHHGLISGAFGPLSALSIQLFHALTPLVGSGDAAARAASALIGVLALTALYVLGNRLAGRTGAAAAAAIALASDPFRDAAVSGTDTTTRILAVALFLFAVHAALAEVSVTVVILLAITGAFVALADPLWLTGVAFTIAILTLAYARFPPRQRLGLAAAGLVLLTVLVLPNRLSVGDQHGGNLFGDLTERATIAASNSRSLASADHTGMAAYLFDRSPTSFTSDALRGFGRSLKESAGHGESNVAGLLAFVIAATGTLMLLIVPRLRMFVLLAALIALPGFLLAGRDVDAAFDAGAPLWCAMVGGGAVLVFVLLTTGLARRLVPRARKEGAVIRPRPFGVQTPVESSDVTEQRG